MPSAVGQTGLAIEGVVRALRSECPFNRTQGVEELLDGLQAELDELRTAVVSGSSSAAREELGDVIFNVVALAAVYDERGDFSLADVDAEVAGKMVRRHPYVFSDAPVPDADLARQEWERAKQDERRQRLERRVGLSALADVSGLAADGVTGETLMRAVASISAGLGLSADDSAELCLVVADTGPDSVVVACALPERRLVTLMTFTAGPAEPERLQSLIEAAFAGAKTRLSVREVGDER